MSKKKDFITEFNKHGCRIGRCFVFDVLLNLDCNLNCTNCLACSPLFDHEEYPLDIFERDLRKIAELTKKFKLTRPLVILSGGEPLLNKNLLEYLKIAKFFNFETCIMTNGILFHTLSDEILKFLSENDVCIELTTYPGIDYKKCFETLRKYNIRYEIFSEILKDYFSKDTNLVFQKSRLCENRVNQNLAFFNCRERNGVLYHGKIYQCRKPIISKKLNEIYGTNFIVTDDDYLDIYKVSSMNEVKQFYKRSKHFCGYCKDKLRPPKKNTCEWSNKHADLKIEFIEN